MKQRWRFLAAASTPGTMVAFTAALGAARMLALAATCGLAATAPAATLNITVTGADGKPAADAVVLVQPPPGSAAPPPRPVQVIEQREIRFVPYVAVVPLGGSVKFVNRDNFDHHIRTLPGGPMGNVAPAKPFEFRLAAARRSGDTSEEFKLDVAGSILLGCHLHGSMRGHVLVSTTPWVAVTDDNGRARVEGLPDGAVELRVWHPDQIVEQAAQRLQLAAGAEAQARLNFTPRRRPPPRRADQEYGPPGSN